MSHLRRLLILFLAVAICLGTGNIFAPDLGHSHSGPGTSLIAESASIAQFGPPNACHTQSHPLGACSLLDAVIGKDLTLVVVHTAQSFYRRQTKAFLASVVSPDPYPPKRLVSLQI